MNEDRFRRELALLPVVHSTVELPAALREAVTRSPACMAILSERIALDRLLAEVPDIAPSADLAERTVRRALTARSGARPGQAVAWARAAAVILAVGLGAMLYRGRQGVPEPTPELLSQLDPLLDWELVNEQREQLDLLAAADLVEAVAELSDGEVAEVPR